MVDNKKTFNKPKKSNKPQVLQSQSYNADSHRNMFGGIKTIKPTQKGMTRPKVQVHRLQIDTSLVAKADVLPKKVHTVKNGASRQLKEKENRSKSRGHSKSPRTGVSTLVGGKSQTYLRSEYNPRGKVVVKKNLKAPLTRKVPQLQEERKVMSGGSRRQQ